MPLADYEHWNEDAYYHWWHEEGKHDYEPEYDDHPEQTAEDAFYEEVCEMTLEQIYKHLSDADYRRRWPKAVDILQEELHERQLDI